MRNVFAYIATASVVSVTAPVTIETSELRLFQRLTVFHEQLLSSDEKRTNPKGLANLIREVKEKAQDARILYAKALTFAELLEKARSREDQEFLFAELSHTLKDRAPKFEFHAFYCPVTNKTWIAKGEKVRNPYLIDARESGTILN
ncbi:hypothetical protein EHQ53_09400 [Leptospira langatensis]|uniref:Uncharacterized protein n=1 Tax=Leptospira langatensis TaxID=2484983 RepID=A0A5F1ZV98_9LEPT|nr:hypothetical protein [Leptospira langatensis]TGK01168.1 hypothetical protein EHO57_09475 [Leptospira langatensis]TGL42380.1 hypothetical protein EHQ53_09400 [Leptospira langatensis]